jgi:TOTE conflict system, Archaeo-Eukaryotic Primase domain
MEQRPELGLDSYDRLFPSRDTLAQGGFGGLIALPLQKEPRDRGNSVFLDDDLNPWVDQWAFLASLRRLGREQVQRGQRHPRLAGGRGPAGRPGVETGLRGQRAASRARWRGYAPRHLFLHATRTVHADAEGVDRARSATEAFLFR